MRRVVVTGLGMVTPLGWGVEATWKGILAGKSGAGRITAFDPADYACQVACEVPRVDGRGGGGPDIPGAFDPGQVMAPKDQRRVDDFILYAIAAADEAVRDSGWAPQDEESRERTGVMIGSGIGGLATIEVFSIELHEKGPRRVSPFFIPSALINLASGQVSIRHGFKGPNHAVMTACGAEAAICPVGIAGFVACRAMATAFNATPEKASRPYDKDRDGFIMGEGAGILVLEEYEHAKARGAKIYAEVAGYGLSGDAYHITAPVEDGAGGFRAMKAALKDAGITPDQIDYVNAHGTSTMADGIELGAVERLLGNAAGKTAMSSTKSMTGHLLGAAGAIESAFSILAIRDQIAPPTINLDNPDVETVIDLVPHKAKPMKIEIAMSNSFGFGGTNASVIFKQVS